VSEETPNRPPGSPDVGEAGAEKREPDYERFHDWVKDGFREGRRREARPIMRLVALTVIILCLAWGATRPSTLKSALVDDDHPRTPIPVGIAVGESPSWSVENVQSAVDTVKPRAAKCLEGWSGMAMNKDGQVVVEVVLTPDGPEEAALYDQVGDTPASVAECLGAALGSVAWPLPAQRESLPFPIVGG
jgi:hypothetical protein